MAQGGLSARFGSVQTSNLVFHMNPDLIGQEAFSKIMKG